MFHVTSVANRDSILRYGLDWSRMGAARGIAGSRAPEAEGVFLASSESEAAWFADMNNTGTAVDVWEVSGIDEDQLLGNGSGYFYYPGRIPADQITLVKPPRQKHG
jgi:hypothetical protein